MSYCAIHEIKSVTVETAGYGYTEKAICVGIKASLTAAGCAVAETLNAESATEYNVTWIIDNRYKLDLYNSGATGWMRVYLGVNATESRSVSVGDFAYSALSFTYWFHLYIGSGAFVFAISGATDTVAGYSKSGIFGAVTTYTDEGGNTVPLVYLASSTSKQYFFSQRIRANNNCGVQFPTSGFYKDASVAVSVSAAGGAPTDIYGLNIWLIPYTTSDNGRMDAYFKGPPVTDSYVFAELMDTNGALYLTCNGSYWKVG